MKALIFGAGGQDGRFLSALLKNCNIEVIGVSRMRGEVRGDVADLSFVDALIKMHLPKYIFHFAATSSTRHSALFDNHLAICTGTLNILESAKQYCPEAKIFLSGSAMQFRNEGNPIDEQTPFEASSPYSIARIQSTYAGRYYRSAFGMQVYCGYLFNHDSPLRSEQHVNQKIACAAMRIASGSDEKLQLGDINVEKEFNYAGDVVDAIWMLVNQSDVFEAIIGCGEVHSIRQWIECCFESIEIDWKDHVIIQSDYEVEYRRLISNPSLVRALGWRPKFSFLQLANLMLENTDRCL